MGRLYVSSYANGNELGVKKRAVSRQITLGPTALKFIAIVIFASLGVIYLTQSTRGANLSVELRTLDSQQQELNQKIDCLNAEGARLKALDNVYNQTSEMQMQPSTQINYLPNSEPLAKK